MTTSTVLTLVVVPVIYYTYLEGFSGWVKGRRERDFTESTPTAEAAS